jgi:tetratricopeptide (TPR) repeat protein
MEHNTSLAATIELSLASPLFQGLGPDAQAILGVVAFYPQGVNENNIDWLFPTVPNRTNIFDTFCILSLTYRSGGFATMLAPLRDHLCPKDPTSSSLLCTTRECYFTRMSVTLNPNEPNFVETQWIASEDTNVEHLLDVFTTIDPGLADVWGVCTYFMRHLNWHKKRLVVLKAKIEGLPDDHSSKPECLFELSQLSGSVGNQAERKRLLTCALKLERERGRDHQVAQILRRIANANIEMGLPKEGIQLVKEALEIGERLGDPVIEAGCLVELALWLRNDSQFDAAEEAASRAISLYPEKGEEYRVCGSHQILGVIYSWKGDTKKAIHHYEVALGIASPFGWDAALFWVHSLLADLFCDEDRFDEANTHMERAKSHTANSVYNSSLAMMIQARVWYEQDRLEEARSEALCAADVFEKLGAAKEVERCRTLLRNIQEELDTVVSSGRSESNCELIQKMLLSVCINHYGKSCV